MNIWFGCTTAQWPKYKDKYFAIRDYLKELGCTITFDWLEDAEGAYDKNDKPRSIEKIFTKTVKAIESADAVVIEYTVPNFSSSHQINYALLKKKPTLVMRLYKDNPRFKDSYIEALQSQSPNLKLKIYDMDNYKEVLREFIGYSKLEQGSQRYNIVLDKRQKQYLDWATVKYSKSRSMIVRHLIDRKIDADKDYKKFLDL